MQENEVNANKKYQIDGKSYEVVSFDDFPPSEGAYIVARTREQ